jgi:hypothetical protein
VVTHSKPGSDRNVFWESSRAAIAVLPDACAHEKKNGDSGKLMIVD